MRPTIRFSLIAVLAIVSLIAQAPPTANLTATFGGQTASVSFTILPPTVLAVASSISAISTPVGKTIAFDLGMTSTCSNLRPACLQPAGLQFQIQAPSASISSFTVTEGAAATTAAKTWSCAVQAVTGQTATKCILAGLNQLTIASGIVAHVSAMVAPTATGTATVSASGFVASNLFGNAMTGSISSNVSLSFVATLGLACAQLFVEPGEQATCTISLSPASATSSVVSLSTDHATSPGLVLPSPASATVAANATSATFAITGQ